MSVVYAKQISTHTITIDGMSRTTSWVTEPVRTVDVADADMVGYLQSIDTLNLAEEDVMRAQRAHVVDGVREDFCEEAGEWHYTAKINQISPELYEVTIVDVDTGRVIRTASVEHIVQYIY